MRVQLARLLRGEQTARTMRSVHARITLLMLALVVLGAAAVVREARSPIEGLVSPNVDERVATKHRLVAERQAIIKDLILLVKEPPEEAPGTRPEHQSRALAIQLLGELRAAEAVDVLVAHLTLKTPVSVGSLGQLIGPGTNYPAAGSLARIGAPSLERAWYLIQMSDDPLTRKLCVWIVREVEGREVARKLVEERMRQK